MAETSYTVVLYELDLCPFCGCGADNIDSKPFPANRAGDLWIARCGNPNCEAEIVGDSAEDVARRWNRRQAAQMIRQRTMAEPVTDEDVWHFLDAAKVHGIQAALESFAAGRGRVPDGDT